MVCRLGSSRLRPCRLDTPVNPVADSLLDLSKPDSTTARQMEAEALKSGAMRSEKHVTHSSRFNEISNICIRNICSIRATRNAVQCNADRTGDGSQEGLWEHLVQIHKRQIAALRMPGKDFRMASL